MGDLVLLNFKVPPEIAYSIQREMGFHDLNRSEFVRRVADLMSKVGKILVTLEKV